MENKDFKYENMLSTTRFRKSKIEREVIDEFYSDRSRVLYCSSFRHLQQKAQVFSLESNSSVRTRMTHSLEVSDLGRTLANSIGKKLYEKDIISVDTIPQFVAIVENACLLHDIGNPPFGHFGEAAIRDWADQNLSVIVPKKLRDSSHYSLLMSDFKEFDGNPQGIRTVTKLHTETDNSSLNLTYSTILCMLKYSRASGEDSDNGILKKAGYFQSEKAFIENMYKEVGINPKHRYPLTYIMEAADDIAYCLSDISDGIEKHILTCDDFLNEFKNTWELDWKGIKCPVDIPKTVSSFNRDISVPWSKQAVSEAVNNYINNHEQFYIGEAVELIPKDSMGRVFDTIKKVSRKILYTSVQAESIELTGYSVITGILKHYSRLLKMDIKDFTALVSQQELSGFGLEKRLFNRIEKRYIKAYKFEIAEYKNRKDYPTYEMWLRVHLIVDHVSGMTDDFALETYQMLEGINLKR